MTARRLTGGRSAWLHAALALAVLAAGTASGCGPRPTEDGPPVQRPTLERASVDVAFEPPMGEQELGERLKSAFETSYPQFKLEIMSADASRAVAEAGRKAIDVAVVRAGPEAEQLATGSPAVRALFRTDYVVVGPRSDPARVSGSPSGAVALQRIARRGAPFFAASATSTVAVRTASLWTSAAVDPAGAPWYQSTGEDAGATLQAATDRGGYALSDRATWLANAPSLSGLTVLVEGPADLADPYVSVVIAGARHPEGARVFWDWLGSEQARGIIASFGADRFGGQVLLPPG